MRMGRAGALTVMMQPEMLPSLFATAEPDAPRSPRLRVALGDWPRRMRIWLNRDASRRYGFWDRSAASW